MKLIDEWKRAHRLFSVQAMSAAGALLGAWEAVPADLKASIPASWVHWGAVALLALGVVGRLIDQAPKDVP